MNKFTNPLDNVKIASPCSQDWNQMIGNDRQRFCGDCKLNVYNLSEMTKAEAENFLAHSENRLCVRFYRRADGTVLTKDCPVGWARVKRWLSKTATAFASLFFGLLSGLGLMSLSSNKNDVLIGEVESYPTATPRPKPTPKNYPVMGNISMPTPKATPKKVQETEMGAVAVSNN